jgi:hypothetical protein
MLGETREFPALDLFDRAYWRAHGIDNHNGPYFSGRIQDKIEQRSMSVMSRRDHDAQGRWLGNTDEPMANAPLDLAA